MMKIRALTMLNESGDQTIIWTPDRDQDMEKIIERKMAEGCVFYIIDPRFGTRERLLDPRDANRHRMLAIVDEDFLKFVTGGSDGIPQSISDGAPRHSLPPPRTDVEVEELPTAAAVKTPSKPVRGARRARTAKEVATSESVGTRPRAGG